jgi:hypothetical protein
MRCRLISSRPLQRPPRSRLRRKTARPEGRLRADATESPLGRQIARDRRWDEERGELVSLPNRVAKKLLEEDEEIRELAKRYVAAKGVSRLPILEPELARRVSDLSR